MASQLYPKQFAFLIAAVIAVGGYFYPLLGLGALGLIAAALIMNIRKQRSFCAGVCPNGVVLATGLKPVSLKKRMPRLFAGTRFRRVLCGFMMFCVISLLVRVYPSLGSIGKVFWIMYIISLTAGIFFGLLFKPRAWCAFCPLGTLQDTIGGATKGAE